MPEICRFLGIIITMNFGDHQPPHFHARYGDSKAIVEIRTLQILDGALPPRVLGLVVEWAALHRDELVANWTCVISNLLPARIAPLE